MPIHNPHYETDLMEKDVLYEMVSVTGHFIAANSLQCFSCDFLTDQPRRTDRLCQYGPDLPRNNEYLVTGCVTCAKSLQESRK